MCNRLHIYIIIFIGGTSMKKVSKNLFILGAICLGLTACNSGGSDDKTCKVDFSSLGEIVKMFNMVKELLKKLRIQ